MSRYRSSAPSPSYSSLAFTLPIPPSANRYWRTNRYGQTYVSEEAQVYKMQVGWKMRSLGAVPWHVPVSVSVVAHMPYPLKGDLSNLEKVLLDALKGYVMKDDNLVFELHMFRRYDKADPRVEVEVKPL